MQNCFVCNLPILSHQVGLVWQGGNGVDDLLREQMENVSFVSCPWDMFLFPTFALFLPEPDEYRCTYKVTSPLNY